MIAERLTSLLWPNRQLLPSNSASLWQSHKKPRAAWLMASADMFTVIAGVTVLFAFSGLVWSFISSDFSVALVTNHSHSAKPLIYKISGTGKP